MKNTETTDTTTDKHVALRPPMDAYDTLRYMFTKLDTIRYTGHEYDGRQWHKKPSVIQVGEPQYYMCWNPLDRGFKVPLGDNRMVYVIEYMSEGVTVSMLWGIDVFGGRHFHVNNYRDEDALAADVIAYIRTLLSNQY